MQEFAYTARDMKGQDVNGLITADSRSDVMALLTDRSLFPINGGGATRVMPNYNVMGVAKAALEASVRYLASDYGPSNIRVNAISAGPVRTLAGAGVADAREMFNYQKRNAPLRRTVSLDEIGGSALYLLSDLGGGVTGEVHFVDSGYSTISMPCKEELSARDKS